MSVTVYADFAAACVRDFGTTLNQRVFASHAAINFADRPFRKLIPLPQKKQSIVSDTSTPEKKIAPIVPKTETVSVPAPAAAAVAVPQAKPSLAAMKARATAEKLRQKQKEAMKNSQSVIVADKNGKISSSIAAKKAPPAAEANGDVEMSAAQLEREEARARGEELSSEEISSEEEGGGDVKMKNNEAAEYDAVNELHERNKFVSGLAGQKGGVRIDEEEVYDAELAAKELLKGKNYLDKEVTKGPNAIVRDKPLKNQAAQDRRLKDRVAEERAAEVKREKLEAKETEERLSLQQKADEEAYEDDEDEEEREYDGTKVVAAKLTVPVKPIDTTLGAAANAKTAALSKILHERKAAAAKKQLDALKKEPVNSPPSGATVIAALAPATPSVSDEELMPQLIYKRMLPPSHVKILEDILVGFIRRNKPEFTEEQTENTINYVLPMLCGGLVYLEATRNNAKDAELLEDSEIFDVCNGDFSREKLLPLSRQQNKRRCWSTEAQKGTRGANMVKLGPNDPLGVRAIDWAYTKWRISQCEKLLPDNFRTDMLSVLFNSMVCNGFVTVANCAFVASALDVARVNGSLPKGEKWRCAMTNREICAGDKLLCYGGSPDCLEDGKTLEDYKDALRRGIKYKSHEGFGITTAKQFFDSDLALESLKKAPYYGFVITEKKNGVVEKDQPVSIKKEPVSVKKEPASVKAEQPVARVEKAPVYDSDNEVDEIVAVTTIKPPASEENATAEAAERKAGEKRRAESEAEETGEEESANGAVEGAVKPQAKKPRSNKSKSFEIVMINAPVAFNVSQAPMEEADTRYEFNGKIRSLVASVAIGCEKGIAPGYSVALTDSAVAAIARADKWLIEELQREGPAAGGRDFYGVSPKDALSATEMFNLLFVSRDFKYASIESNTASVFAEKLLAMSTLKKSDPLTGKTTKMYSEKILGQWLMFILASFTHAVEYKLLEGAPKILGRLTAESQVLEASDKTRMVLGYVPFGRQLTSTPFTLQMVRLVLDAVFAKIVKQLADKIALHGAEVDIAAVEADFVFDEHVLISNLREHLHDEAPKLTALAETIANLDPTDVMAQEEAVRKYLTAENDQCSKASTRVGKPLHVARTNLTRAWEIVRKRVLRFEFSEDVRQLPHTHLFVSRVFPRVF